MTDNLPSIQDRTMTETEMLISFLQDAKERKLDVNLEAGDSDSFIDHEKLEGVIGTLVLGRNQVKMRGDFKQLGNNLNEIIRDAKRWRSLMACARMRYMGSAGFDFIPKENLQRDLSNSTPQPRPNAGMHFGMEFWSEYKMTDEERKRYPDTFERELLSVFVDEMIKRKEK